jgi:hypothetical protein
MRESRPDHVLSVRDGGRLRMVRMALGKDDLQVAKESWADVVTRLFSGVEPV